MNNAAINIPHISVWKYFLFLFWYLPGELLDHMVTKFNHLRNCQTIFQSGQSILHSYSILLL
jgi:hypothetical protein